VAAYRRRSHHGIAACHEHTGEKTRHYPLHHTHATKLTATRSKWPVIVGIILGSILALSIIWCMLKCICGGIADCCCGCCDCCSSRKNNNHAYQQPPPQYPMQNQYYGPQQPVYSAAPMYAPSPMYAPPPMSGGAGYRGAPSTSSPYEQPYNNNKPFNEDALPAFPTTASERRLPYDDMEMQSPQAAQQQEGLLSSHNNANTEYYHSQQQQQPATDTAPSHNYDSHRQYAPQSLYSQQDAVPTPGPNRVTSMRSTQYEPSLYPPSYHTQAAGNATHYAAAAGGTTSPPPLFTGHAIERKPVQGTWRDV
jgi:hypothetical protein